MICGLILQNGNRMIIADDGGAQISFDGGDNWSTYENQPTAQFYRVLPIIISLIGYWAHNRIIQRYAFYQELMATDQTRRLASTAGSESGYVVADPLNPDIVYGGNYGGYFSRFDHKTGENRAVSVWPVYDPWAAVPMFPNIGFNGTSLFSFHHTILKNYMPAVIFYLLPKMKEPPGHALRGDLTTNDKSKQKSSGGPITKDNTGVEVYCTIFTATESPLEKDLLWTGSDDGLINVSKDGGAHWENVTPKEAGQWMMWNCVETDPFKKGKAYFVGTKYKTDDFTPYIFITEDYGKTWKKITNGIAPMHFARCLRADKKDPGLLYCGTEYGMYISYDDGENWKPFQLNLPMVPITDLTIKKNDLVVATQGRSFCILDDLGVVQNIDKNITQDDLHIFPVDTACRMNGSQNLNVKNAGINPPNGVVVNYYLKDIQDSSLVKIFVLDKDKKIVSPFSTKPSGDTGKIEVSKGMNQFVWNMQLCASRKNSRDGFVEWKCSRAKSYTRANIISV